jgi:hypothetical protein
VPFDLILCSFLSTALLKTSAASPANATISCDAPAWEDAEVGTVQVSVSLNGIDYTTASLPFVFYKRPVFKSSLPVFPIGAPKAGSTMVTLLGANFDARIMNASSSTDGISSQSASLPLVWCRFKASDSQQVSVPAIAYFPPERDGQYTTEKIVCATPYDFLASDPRESVKVSLALSLNNQSTFHDLAENQELLLRKRDKFTFFTPPMLSSVFPLGGPTRVVNTIQLSGTAFTALLVTECSYEDTYSMYRLFLGNVRQKTETNEACNVYATRTTRLSASVIGGC